MDDLLEDFLDSFSGDINTSLEKILPTDSSWYALAERVLGDPLRVDEILQLNPSKIFKDPASFVGESIKLPSEEQIYDFAKPQLEAVGLALAEASGTISQVRSILSSASDKLPPSLQGYAKEAIGLSDRLNGITDEVEQFISEDSMKGLISKYGATGTTLVRWLLGKR